MGLTTQVIRAIGVLFVSLHILLGCSGGGLESDSNDPVPAVLVNAGPNQSVNEGVTVVLSGTASGTGTLTYSWSASPLIALTQSSETSPEATFVAPITTEVLTYVFTLVVTDSQGNQATDSVQYTINPLNEAPNALVDVIQPLDIVDNRYPAGIEIVLDGSASNDPDATDSLNPIATWRWQQTAGVDVLQDVSLDGDKLAFTAPILDQASSLEFTLTVTDQEGATDSAQILLSMLSASDTVPLVDAGVDHQVYPGEIIMLSGSGSTSVPAAQPLIFQWLNDSQLTPQIDAQNAAQTFAIAPEVNFAQLITFTLTVMDAFGNRVEDSVSVRVIPRPLQALNDTGVDQQASNTLVGPDHQGESPGQDGQRGQDIISNNGQFEKAGRGDVGFDFTRLDAIGDEQDDITQPWSCVRDNTTGLVWEVKTNDTGLHGQGHDYSWFLDENNGGYEGPAGNAGLTCSIASCDTLSFVQAVNSAGLCNFYDWRLPTYNELLSIVHFGIESGPLIDEEYFPFTDDGNSDPLWYWSSQPNADGVAEDEAQNAWAMDFLSGNDNFLNKATQVKVRLVRGGR